MDVVERSKALFHDKLDARLVAEVETWDMEHQDYFWTYAYSLFQQILDAKMIESIMHGSSDVKPVGIAKEPPSPTPFSDAERVIRPGKWFTSGTESMIRR